MIPPFSALPDDEITAVLAAADDILRSGRLVLGPHTAAFEGAIATMAGTRYAAVVSSGSTALEIVFRAIGAAGHVVLVPANTNYATAAAALAAGARVRLYDSGLYPDMSDLRTKLTADVAAVVVVHIGGYLSPDLPTLTDLCEQAGAVLIEDAAHAHGSTLDGYGPAGSFGAAAAFSFFATKTITAGEGGAITTNDPVLDRAAPIYRNQGKDADDRHVVVGGSWRITELGAALANVQLAHLPDDLVRRRSIIDRYTAHLSGTGITFPELYGQVSGHKCIATLAAGVDRERFRTAVLSGGVVLARGVYEKPLHRHPVFADIADGRQFPVADEFARTHFRLPLWRGMDDDTVGCVIEAVRAALPR
ncbi:DegT/DnrJ/EryC1/StrS aminotransferase family protein [Nocardia sp. NEAU-G5]|uniref:DegT/DnrJ/EryC1/StrS aminotransferase family protein n=1 Tax=Nocardia albiluteola TaxID=2842303 RepID=A0ABS6AYL3_9NOCA|nr:DegT/DnrJ/EryC1/StrS aminotransferase family protein [Nocardia albiluteola]MBU3063132.1 DegT/DnrJ/EryC1/StrS aminotransferase family protein [Nocardia albiluteola]